LREAYDRLEVALVEQRAAQGAGAVLIPGEEAFGDNHCAASAGLKRFEHKFHEENRGLALGGILAPDVGIGFLVALRAKGRVGNDGCLAVGQNLRTKFFQRVALLNVAGVEAAHVEIDRGHLANHPEVFDACNAGAVKVCCSLDRRHGDGVSIEPSLKPGSEFRVLLWSRPAFVTAHTLQNIFKAIEHETAGADSRIE